MKGYEGHSVVVAELVVKAHESHSVGRHTNDTNLASCAGPLDGARRPWRGAGRASSQFIA